MIKYVIIGFNNPNINKGTADLTVLCQRDGQLWWKPIIPGEERVDWFTFDDWDDAHVFSESYDNVVVYGVHI